LGFDAAVNYKAEPVLESLKKHCPDGIDVHFENVGGTILDAALSLINLHARIVLCGLISIYNATEPGPSPYNMPHIMQIIVKRARAEGFLVLDYMDRARDAMRDLGKWYADGKLRYRVDIVDGLQSAPRALNKLFDGSNKGKLVVKL
jgi:NADPH-dependent curcumin reductase CurA